MQTELRGLKLHYEVYGEASHVPPLLLLHGWGCSVKHFSAISEQMSKERMVVAVDFPAHGESSKPAEPWGVPDFANLICDLIDELNIKGCDIIAHSFGGRVAIWIASQHPEYVGRMILTGCAGIKKEQTEEQKKKSRKYKKKKALIEKIGKIYGLKSLSEKILKKLQTKYSSADYNALDDEMKKTFVKVISQDLRPMLKEIKASVLLVWGENDTETPLWMGQIMENEIKDAGLVVFENDDHFAYLRQWPRFVAVAKAFLK